MEKSETPYISSSAEGTTNANETTDSQFDTEGGETKKSPSDPEDYPRPKKESPIEELKMLTQACMDADIRHDMFRIATNCFQQYTAGRVHLRFSASTYAFGGLKRNPGDYPRERATEILNSYLEKYYGLESFNTAFSIYGVSLELKELGDETKESSRSEPFGIPANGYAFGQTMNSTVKFGRPSGNATEAVPAGFSFGGIGTHPAPYPAPTGALFQQPAPTPAFGTSTCAAPFENPSFAPAFGTSFGTVSNDSHPGTSDYERTTVTDGINNIVFTSITAMPRYQEKSFEELRLEDYSMGNQGRGTVSVGASAPVASVPAPATTAAPAAGGGFSFKGTSCTPEPVSSRFSFGAAPAPAGGGPNYGPSFSFGAAPAPAFGATSAFGAPAPPSEVFGGFGAPALQPCGWFGSNPAPGGVFGSAPAPAPSGGSFGSGQAAPSGSGIFGATVPEMVGGGLFRAPSASATHSNRDSFGTALPFGTASPFGAPSPMTSRDTFFVAGHGPSAPDNATASNSVSSSNADVDQVAPE